MPQFLPAFGSQPRLPTKLSWHKQQHSMDKRLTPQVSSINTVDMSFLTLPWGHLSPWRFQKQMMTRFSSLEPQWHPALRRPGVTLSCVHAKTVASNGGGVYCPSMIAAPCSNVGKSMMIPLAWLYSSIDYGRQQWWRLANIDDDHAGAAINTSVVLSCSATPTVVALSDGDQWTSMTVAPYCSHVEQR